MASITDTIQDRIADGIAEIVATYGIDTTGLTDLQVLSLGFDAACEDEDEVDAEKYDQLISLARQQIARFGN